jgi:hypothetical protein
MNVFAPRRLAGRLAGAGFLVAAFAAGAVAAGPTVLASQPPARSQSSVEGHPAKAGSVQTVSAAGTITWSEIPSSATEPDSRSKFTYTNIKPGSTIFDHVAVINRSSFSVAFNVYATDATGTTQAGALTLMPATEKPRDIGSWVVFRNGARRVAIIIDGGKGVILAFKIAVPRNATPGDHTGGMIASVGFQRTNSKGQVVREDQRIAVPLELRVTGRLRAGLQVQSISTGFHSPINPFATGSATVSYTVVNTGNVRLSGRQIVSVTGPFGSSSKLKAMNLPVVLPGDSIRYTTQAGGLYPLGPMTAHVSVSLGLPPGAPPMTLPAGYVTGSASLFAVPWSLVVLVILLIGAAFGGYWGRGWWHRMFRARLDAAAESARRETERRLLGDKGAATGSQRQA